MNDATRAESERTVPTRPAFSRRRAFFIGILVVLTAVLFQSNVRTHDQRLSGIWLVTVGERPAGNLTAEQALESGSGNRSVWYFRPDGTGGKSNTESLRYGPRSGDGFRWWIQGGRLHIDASGEHGWGSGGMLRMIEAVVMRLLGNHTPRHLTERFDFNVEDGKTVCLRLTVEDEAAPVYLTWLEPVPARPVSRPVSPVASPIPPVREQETSTISDLYVEERLRDAPR